MSRTVRIIFVLLLSVLIVLSCTVLAARYTTVEGYAHTVEVLNSNRSVVLGLSAASAAVSTAITFLPGDGGNPIAEKLADFSSYFLIILCVIYFEKYLLTVQAFIACYLCIPIGCALLILFLIFGRVSFRRVGLKLAALGALLLIVTPIGTWVSDRINDVYADSIQLTVDSANSLCEKLTTETPADAASSGATFLDKLDQLTDTVDDSVSGILEQVKAAPSRFLEAIAVLLVVNCLIPALVLLAFLWGLKLLFHLKTERIPYDYFSHRPPRRRPAQRQGGGIAEYDEN